MGIVAENSKWMRFWPLIFVAGIAFLVFSGTLSHELVWDDEPFARSAERIFKEKGLPGLLTSEFKPDPAQEDEIGYYRPLSLASLLVTSMLSSWLPPSHHLFNVLLHVLNSLIFLVLANRLLMSRAAALGGALLFAVHPVHTEAVAFVSGRGDLLAAFFCLSFMVVWLKVRRVVFEKNHFPLVLGMIAFTAGCLSKEIVYMLPLVVAGFSLLLYRNDSFSFKSWLKRDGVWIFGPLLIVVLVVLFRVFILEIPFGGGVGFLANQHLSGGSVTGSVGVLFLKYFRLLTIPWPLQPYYLTSSLTPGWPEFLSLAIAGVWFLIPLWPGDRRWNLGLFFWVIVFLVPVAGFFHIHGSPLAERFLYLPSAGFCLFCGGIWGRIYKKTRFRMVSIFIGTVLILVFSLLAVQYSKIWKDDQALFSKMIGREPRSVVGYFNLANDFLKKGRLDGAEWAYKKSMEVYPEFTGSYLNLANLYLMKGSRQKALLVLERALGANLRDPAVINRYNEIKHTPEGNQKDPSLLFDPP